MDKETRSAIERATQRARKLLEADFSEQIEGTYDVLRSGAIPKAAGAHLGPRQRVLREKILASIAHKTAAGMKPAEAVADYLRDAAFTTLNRFVALKMLEARGLVQECVSKGDQSSGYHREFCGLAPGVALLPDGAGYRLYLECIFDELSTEVKVLFDRRDPASVLWPRRQALTVLLEVLNGPDLAGVWREDETIGWVYQYFNSKEERAAMRETKQGGSQAPHNSRELAVRNQFFTPRYVVQFLTDNTLGRIWYQMRQAETVLKERCEYLVRQPMEVFLGEWPERQGNQDLPDWLAATYEGDFAKLPEELPWGATAKLAHVINGYEVAPAIGLGDCGELANRKSEEYKQAGIWTGNAAELWCCLFFEHRRYRHFGHDPEGEALDGLGALYKSLRARLNEEPASQEDALKQPVFVRHRPMKDPRDLKILDPACGSGHFLLYAFDLLTTIYEEAWCGGRISSPVSEATGKTLREDYADEAALRRAIPELILQHNLHGVDIDPRCVQIAQLALWMRAQRAFHEAGLSRAERSRIRKTNIVLAEPMPGEEDMRREFTTRLRDKALAELFDRLVERMQLAGDMGLLLRVEELVRTSVKTGETGNLFAPAEERIRAALQRFAEEAAVQQRTARRLFAEDTLSGLGLIDVAEKKYDVVLMNPPFGAGSVGAKKELEATYLCSKNDMYAAFVERGTELAHRQGMLGAITSRTGYFVSSLTAWRKEILLGRTQILTFADLGNGVLDGAMVETAAICLERL
ncbi:DNA methyltransferase [Sorangium sp. So ce295]|uniref:Eco57I restriction-modification methylase domain-containing protein n=1 Tax=Sorangium sp. So ce295 TaxID=3133295 RepID=UPI003F620543